MSRDIAAWAAMVCRWTPAMPSSINAGEAAGMPLADDQTESWAAVVPTEPPPAGTKFGLTADAVEAEQTAELDRLAELTTSGLSPLEACRALNERT